MTVPIEPIDSYPRTSKIRKRVAVMSGSSEPTSCFPRTQHRLGWGLRLLDEWFAGAGQVEKNAVSKALFAISDRTVFRTYKILDVADRPRDFFVVVRDDLVMQVHVRDLDVFGIAYIGSPDESPVPIMAAAAVA